VISKPYGVRTAKRYSQYPFVEYSEGIFLGYRGMMHFGVEPLFPLGYGLTYSSFSYSDLSIKNIKEGLEVSFTIANSGKVKASEVAQIYVTALGSAIPKADLELKGYEKVSIDPGKSQRVTVLLPFSSISHYDASSHAWVNDSGSYRISVGASALDIRLSEEIGI
jgi:beta-glucosidase